MAMAMAMARATAKQARPEGQAMRAKGKQRSGVRLGMPSRRTLIAGVATLAIAGFATCKTIGNVFAERAPQFALRLDPGNALALANLADRRFSAAPARSADVAEPLARRSLRAQGLNPGALRTLGYVAEVRKAPKRATALMEMSIAQSRRDRGAQLWMIEHAVQNDNVAGALRNYDVALRTSRANAELLYPILTGALDDAAIRTAFIPYVRARPVWMQGFLAHAISNSAHPERIAAMLLQTSGALADPRNGEINERLIERLIAQGSSEAARRVYLATPGRSAARLTSPALDPRDTSQRDGTLGWRLTIEANRQAVLDIGTGGAPMLHVETSAGNSGRVAEKLLFLPSGRYAFAASTEQAQLGEEGALQWRLICVAGAASREIWATRAKAGPLAATFDIPSGCPHQSLTLDIVGSEAMPAASADIGGIAVRRLGAPAAVQP